MAGVGAVSVLAPRRVAGWAGGSGARPDPRVVRVLGARQVVQGVATAARPDVITLAAIVDATHALSMVALAAASPTYRRAALASATVAVASVVAAGVARGVED